MIARGVRIATWFYRALLRLLPAARRARDERVMLDLFQRLARDAHKRGGPVLLATSLRAALDIVRESLRLRLASRDHETRQRRFAFTDSLVLDARHALRSLSRRPGFALLACSAFALGIGAATAIFGVVDAVLLRPLPYHAPDRIVRLLGTGGGEVNREGTLAYLNAMDVEAMSGTLNSVAAYDEWRPNLTGAGEPELVSAAVVSTDFFEVLGVQPAEGRFFLAEEDVDGRDGVVVLAHGFWQSRFAADPSIVGRPIVLNGNAHTVVGIAPADFEDPKLSGPRWGEPQIWRPLGYGGLPPEGQPSRGSSSYVAIARLSPGSTLDAARAELAQISSHLEREYPDTNAGDAITAIPLRESIVGDVRASLLLLLGAVGVLLAIAAANAGSLLLGRAAERRREIALRIALGASRTHAVRLVVTESLILALAGGCAGIILALAATRSLLAFGGQLVPRGADIPLSPTIILFAFTVTLLTGLACGIVPALSAFGGDLRGPLAEAGRGGTHARGVLRLRAGLIVAEVALALLLLIGASLLGKSLWRLMNVDVGFQPAGVLTFDLVPPVASYPDDASVTAFYDALIERLRSLPGVESVAGVNIAPLTGGFDGNSVMRADRPPPPRELRRGAEVRTVTPSYFETVSLALRRGRLPDARDRAGTPPIAVISESMALAFWPGEDAIGMRFTSVDTLVEVVGIVADVKHMSLEEAAPPMFYVPRAQGIVPWQTRRMSIVMRTDAEVAALAPAARAEVGALDAQLPLANLRTMEQVIAASAAPPRFRTLLIGAFAALALLLATLGVYGVVSYSVSQRTREMAIRMALGARAPAVLRLVVRQGMTPVAVGLILGLLAALALSRLLSAVLFEVATLDATVFLAVPALMLAIAAFASAAPARRATRVDPLQALREE
jgi:putative ABC transport system permease protein